MELSSRTSTLRLAERFVIAREASDTADVVQVELRHGELRGFGEGAPIDRYGESAASGQAFLEECAALLGDDPCALDAALHDLQGKLTGLPVWRLLGLRRAGPPTSWTIWLGDPDDMARRAE